MMLTIKKYIQKRQNEKINIYMYIYIIQREIQKYKRQKVGLSSFYSFDFKMQCEKTFIFSRNFKKSARSKG